MNKEQQSVSGQRSDAKYKDTVLRTLFRDKSRAIELCNAVAGTNYQLDANVVICDLDNSLLRRFNDVAFAVESQLLIFCEHQSTINPNMPLRLLHYTTDTLYSWFVDGESLYSGSLHKIPAPKFFVLYNGKDKLKEEVLKLSDAYVTQGESFSLELVVKVLDVNYGSGCEALAKSQSLNGYAYLIAQIESLRQQGTPRDAAIRDSIKKCVEEGVLVDFLKENFEEVANMLNLQYDQETEYRVVAREAKAEGRVEGRVEGKIEAAVEAAVEMLKDGLSIEKIAQYTNMPVERVKSLFDKQS